MEMHTVAIADGLDASGDARIALEAAVHDYGPQVLGNPRLLCNLFKDLMPDSPREASLLVTATEAGAVAMVDQRVASVGLESAVRMTADDLARNRALDPQACIWAVGELARALGHPVGSGTPSLAGLEATVPLHGVAGTGPPSASWLKAVRPRQQLLPPPPAPPIFSGMAWAEGDAMEAIGAGPHHVPPPVRGSGGRGRLLIAGLAGAAVLVLGGLGVARLIIPAPDHQAAGGYGDTATNPDTPSYDCGFDGLSDNGTVVVYMTVAGGDTASLCTTYDEPGVFDEVTTLTTASSSDCWVTSAGGGATIRLYTAPDGSTSDTDQICSTLFESYNLTSISPPVQ
ncbi:MAG: hypothetical protein WCB85_10715 [Candidatus Dormiibacterota bacterium]